MEMQQLIYSNYSANGQNSDTEGQLIRFSPDKDKYRFFTDDLSGYRTSAPEIAPGEVYISPSLLSMMDTEIGDTITFPVARSGNDITLTVKGYYEDPFMGSSMIGMKGFLICAEDYAQFTKVIQGSGIDALARDGAMLHIFSALDLPELNSALNDTALLQYKEFVYSKTTILDFMLILQNAFMAMLLAFVMILLCAVLSVISHSIGAVIASDFPDMGILKTMGFTGRKLRILQLVYYLTGIIAGILLGIILSLPVSTQIAEVTVTTTGILIPTKLPLALCIGCFAAMAVLLALFIVVKTRKINHIAPIQVIHSEMNGTQNGKQVMVPIQKKGVLFWLSLRQLLTSKQYYATAFVVAVLLVFLASAVMRMNVWLGPDGKGMMDAFNPADHDLGVQVFGNLTAEETQDVILSYTGITDSYQLAMPSVAVEGMDCTANVIDEPFRFHILSGRTCAADNEIVLTEMLAADLGVSVGDTVTVRADKAEAEFVVSGIYQCANEMGANLGMSREGYLKIGRDHPNLWCYHYFLADTGQKAPIMEDLNARYGGDVHVHENSWPGLFGIINAMQALIRFLYIAVIFFILIVTMMTGSRILTAEQKNMGIYKAIGFSNRSLQLTFAFRFGLIALAGSAVGVLASALLADPLISAFMKLAGISDFSSRLELTGTLLPAAVVIVSFTMFAYLAAGRVKRINLMELVSE